MDQEDHTPLGVIRDELMVGHVQVVQEEEDKDMKRQDKKPGFKLLLDAFSLKKRLPV